MKPKLTKPDIYSNCCLECGFPSLTAHYDGCSKTTKPKTDKQGWEEEFDKLIYGQIYSFPFNTTRTEGWVTVNEEPISIVGLAISNDEVKDFINNLLSQQREEVRREVVEEITTKIRTKRKELWKFYHEAQLWEEQEQIIRPLDELINQLALSSDGEKKGKE